MYIYLQSIENWQKYKAINRGNLLYEMSSNNIAEQPFSWMKESRTLVTPYYVLKSFVIETMERINELHQSAMTENKYNISKR